MNRTAFEAAIRDDPLNESIYLIYADYLDEQGMNVEADQLRNPVMSSGVNYWRYGHRYTGYGGYGGDGGDGGYGGDG